MISHAGTGLLYKYLFFRFDTFGGRYDAEALPQPSDGPNDRKDFLINQQVSHKGAVDLDLVESEAAKMAKTVCLMEQKADLD